jgi:hypothetical protein
MLYLSDIYLVLLNGKDQTGLLEGCAGSRHLLSWELRLAGDSLPSGGDLHAHSAKNQKVKTVSSDYRGLFTPYRTVDILRIARTCSLASLAGTAPASAPQLPWESSEGTNIQVVDRKHRTGIGCWSGPGTNLAVARPSERLRRALPAR